VLTAYQVPKEQFYAQFKIPVDLPVATPLKDIEPLVPDGPQAAAAGSALPPLVAKVECMRLIAALAQLEQMIC
jgi:hypothetical protein